jgi:hypothetical protein
VLCVFTWPNAGVEDHVIARELALGAEMMRRHPHEWVKPIERATKTGDDVTYQIAPLDVRGLVQQHRTAPIIRPLLSASRQHDRWLNDAPGKRRLDLVAHHEPRAPPDLQHVGHILQRSRPIGGVQDPGSPQQVTDPRGPADQPRDDDGRNAKPEANRDRH